MMSSSPQKPLISRPEPLSNRAKTTDKLSLQSRPHIVARYSSEDSAKGSTQKHFDVDAMLKPSSPPQPGDFTSMTETLSDFEIDARVSSIEAGFKVDSKNDFMSALTASLDSNPDTSTEDNSNPLSDRGFGSLLKSSAGPAGRARRWMTLPTNALATIEENDSEDKVGTPSRRPIGGRSSLLSANKSDSETEIVLHPEAKLAKTKQMRVPVVEPKGDAEAMSSFLDSILPSADTKQSKDLEAPTTPEKERKLATDDEDIDKVGTAFLDQISKSMGFGMG